MDLLNAELPKELDFTVPQRFLDATEKDDTTFNPSTNIFMSEAATYKLNWVLVFCISHVLTNGFRFSQYVLKKNYFALSNGNDIPQPFRTWTEGIRAGVQTLAALMGLPLQGDVVWPGSAQIVANKKPPYKVLKDFEQFYGDGFADKVEGVYKQLLDFAKGEDIKLPNPVVIGPPVPPVKDLPKEPVEVPKDPLKPGARPWQLSLAKWIGSLGTLFFIVKLFLPGWINAIVDAVLKILNIIAGA